MFYEYNTVINIPHLPFTILHPRQYLQDTNFRTVSTKLIASFHGITNR